MAMLFYTLGVKCYFTPTFSITNKNNRQNTKLNLPNYRTMFNNSSPITELPKIYSIILLILTIGVE